MQLNNMRKCFLQLSTHGNHLLHVVQTIQVMLISFLSPSAVIFLEGELFSQHQHRVFIDGACRNVTISL